MQQSTTTTTPSDTPSDSLPTVDLDCGTGDSWVCEEVAERTGNETLAGVAEWFVAKPLAVLGILAVAWVANRLARRLVAHWVRRVERVRRATPGFLHTGSINLRSEARAATLVVVAKSVTSAVVWGVALFSALALVEIQLGPLLAGAGVAGVALGFGAQSVVRDFLSGVFMIIEDQFGVGDVIEVSGVIGTQNAVVGTVEGITLRTTRLRGDDGTLWHIPNGEIRRVGNMSKEWARAIVDVDVAPAADLAQALDAVRTVAEGLAAEDPWMADVLDSPEVRGVEAVTPMATTLRVVVKVRPASQWALQRELRARLRAALAEVSPPPPPAPPMSP